MKRPVVFAVFVVVMVTLGATVAFFFISSNGTAETRPLPEGCAKPQGGFLIIASETGFNDSIAHGAPADNWPILDVRQGQNVTIVVCNVDTQAHGFQVTHYYESSEETVSPGQVIKVAFVANEVGKFTIYCEIFCSIHIYMQSGLLNVTSAA